MQYCVKWGMKEETDFLMQCVEKGTHLVFSSLPDVSVVRRNKAVRELLGIRRISASETTVEGIHLYGGFLLGGEVIYKAEEKEEEKYQDMEEDIVAAHRERFYFEKVEAENSYNQEAGISDRMNIAKEDLKINIIYVKDGQDYFSFRSDCAPQTGCHVEDPVVQIYTGNIHCNYAHSFMSQWVYIPSEAESAEEAYQEISDMIRSCGAEESVQKLVASAVANS